MDPAKGFRMPDGTYIPDSAFGFDFHQVAIYSRDIRHSVACLQFLGFDQWYSDTAVLKGQWNDIECTVRAEMHFNYQTLRGKELEFVRYFGHPNQSILDEKGSFISHISAYVDNVDEAVKRIARDFGEYPFHTFETSEHTNPRVAGKKHFREAIFSMSILGFNLKLIEKVIP